MWFTKSAKVVRRRFRLLPAQKCAKTRFWQTKA
jgi:hypothetical protein